MEFVSVIKNECGEVVRICKDYHDDENKAFLEFHPEYYYSTIPVDDYGDYL